MKTLLGIFIFLFFMSEHLLAEGCEEMFAKLSRIPGAIKTIQGLKELYTSAPNETSIHTQLRTSATLTALKELNRKLQEHGIEIKPLELVGLFQHLPKEGEGVKKETEPGPKTNSPETIELPKELIDAWSPENGSSFQNRNHPDALKFRLPKEFKIIEEQLGELLTGGEIGKSSPIFGPDGVIAVGSHDNHVYFYKYNTKTNRIEEVGKDRKSTRLNSSHT